MTIFLADENVDLPIIARLRELGYAVQSIAEDCPGVDDTWVLQCAFAREAVLLTEDKDFGELVFRRRLMNSGIVLYRLPGLSAAAKVERIVQAFSSHSELFPRRFTVISRDQIRVRPNLAVT